MSDISHRARTGLLLLLVVATRLTFAQESGPSLREQAQSYFEAGEPRKAVATLVAAAEEQPKDRLIGAMLYSAVRDRVWHMPQTLPAKHDTEVRALAFNSHSSKLASGSESGEIFISTTEPLDEEEAEAQRVKLKVDGAIVGLAFTKDGQRLAAAAKTGAVQVWEVNGAKPVFTGPKSEGTLTAFAVAKDADLIALGREDGVIRVFDIAAGKLVVEIPPGGGAIRALAFSRSGTKLAAASGEPTAQVWETATGRKIGHGVAHEKAIRAVDFSWDERYVLSGGEDSIIYLSDPEEGIAVLPKMDCGAVVKEALVSPDGSSIAAMLDDDSVSFWDAFTGKSLDLRLREDGVFNGFIWSRSGLRAATISEAGHATFWTMRDGSRQGETMPHDAPVRVGALSADSSLLATGSANGIVRIWRTDGGMPLPTVRSHLARARAAFYSLDGEHLVTTSEDHTALHWRSGQVQPFGPALKHRGKVTCATFDPDATRILTCDDTGIAQLWNAETGRPEGTPYVHKAPVNWVDFHPTGQRCVTAAGPNAMIWSVTDHSKKPVTVTHPGRGKSEIKCARFSPDGKWLVTASTDGTARVWDAVTYRPTGVVINRGFPVLCVRFSPDGSLLVVSGEDAQAAVFETTNWKPVGVPMMASGPVFSAAITTDNLFLVTASFLQNAVQFFEIATGRPLGQGLKIPSQPTCVDYHLEDKVVVVACDDGTVRAIEAPFVTQDVPAWMLSFTERLVGLHKTGPDTFERVDSHLEQLKSYVSGAARSTNADFPKLVRWKLAQGILRNGMPRFTSTLKANIERRVMERSVDAIYECYAAVPNDPLIYAALSLYLPNAREDEFLADLVLKTEESQSPARSLAAAALARAGRSAEAEAALTAALTETPDDPFVLRRAAKFYARQGTQNRTRELFQKTLELDRNDAEARRAFGWALYEFEKPEEAAAQFQLAQDLTGEMDEDLIAGLCLCAAAKKNQTEARSAYARLVSLNPDWKTPAYITGLRGWTQRQLSELERVRQRTFPK